MVAGTVYNIVVGNGGGSTATTTCTPPAYYGGGWGCTKATTSRAAGGGGGLSYVELTPTTTPATYRAVAAGLVTFLNVLFESYLFIYI